MDSKIFTPSRSPRILIKKKTDPGILISLNLNPLNLKRIYSKFTGKLLHIV